MLFSKKKNKKSFFVIPSARRIDRRWQMDRREYHRIIIIITQMEGKWRGALIFPPLMARSRDPIITSSIKISAPRLSLFFPPKFCF